MQRGQHHSEATRAKLRAAWTEERKAEHAERSRKLMLAKWEDPAFRALQREIQAAVSKDPEVLLKRSEAQRKVWLDPAYRARQSEVQAAVSQDPELLLKRAEGLIRAAARIRAGKVSARQDIPQVSDNKLR